MKDGSEMSDKVLEGFGSQTIIVSAIGIVNLLYFSVMSRLLDKEAFGYFAIVTAITSILDEISSAGLGSAIIQRKNIEQSFFHCAFTLSFIIGLFFTILLFLSSESLSHYYVGSAALIIGFKIMSLTFLAHNVTSPIRALYIRNMQFFRYGCYQVSALIISCVFGVLLAYYGFGFISIIIASSASPFLLASVLVVLNHHELKLYLKKKYVSEIISYGGWLTASGIVRSVYEQLDKLITTKWISVALLGAYNRPVGFVNQISGQINGIFDTVLFPILSKSQDDLQKMRHAYMVCTELVFVPSVIIACCFVLCSHLIITIFLGDKWLDLVPIFQIASISMVFMFYNRIGDCFFRSLGIVKDYFFMRIFICLISIICIYSGCKYGITGLIISVLIAKAVESLVKTLFFKMRLGIHLVQLSRRIIKVSFAPLALFCVLFFIEPNCGFIWFEVVALLVFITALALLMKINPQILGESCNNYIIRKYLKNWI